jgi:ABC-type uncharacterized transport system ATPase subunit
MVYGEVDDVRRRHSRPEVRVHARGALPTVAGVAAVADEGDGVWRLMLPEGLAPSDVLGRLVQSGAVIDSFEPMLAPMEDIFLQVVREGLTTQVFA